MIAGLDAKLGQANDNILAQARGRGLGFSGIPVAEQAKYAATDYAPAVAQVKQSQIQKSTSLADALAQLQRDKMNTAQGIYQQDLNRDEQTRQFNEQMAAQERARQAAAASQGFGGLSFGGAGGVPSAPVKSASITQRADKGFAFTDANGKPISAAAFAMLKNIPFRTLLQQMASSGDKGAAAALGFVGNDFGYDPRKVDANLYNSLVWGTGRQATGRYTDTLNMSPLGSINGLSGQGGGLKIAGLR